MQSRNTPQVSRQGGRLRKRQKQVTISCLILACRPVPRYKPILVSAEMNDLGYWVVTWSVAPGLRLPVTCTIVGISRSEAVESTGAALVAIWPGGESA